LVVGKILALQQPFQVTRAMHNAEDEYFFFVASVKQQVLGKT